MGGKNDPCKIAGGWGSFLTDPTSVCRLDDAGTGAKQIGEIAADFVGQLKKQNYLRLSYLADEGHVLVADRNVPIGTFLTVLPFAPHERSRPLKEREFAVLADHKVGQYGVVPPNCNFCYASDVITPETIELITSGRLWEGLGKYTRNCRERANAMQVRVTMVSDRGGEAIWAMRLRSTRAIRPGEVVRWPYGIDYWLEMGLFWLLDGKYRAGKTQALAALALIRMIMGWKSKAETELYGETMRCLAEAAGVEPRPSDGFYPSVPYALARDGKPRVNILPARFRGQVALMSAPWHNVPRKAAWDAYDAHLWEIEPGDIQEGATSLVALAAHLSPLTLQLRGAERVEVHDAFMEIVSEFNEFDGVLRPLPAARFDLILFGEE